MCFHVHVHCYIVPVYLAVWYYTWLCISAGSFLMSQELIPVLLLVIASHPDSKTRDQLLHMMFNLIKRPDRHQRWVCLMGGAK